MEFFCYHRDRHGSVALRDELLEEHWSYMDRYAAEMIARGPTLANDGDTPTGSMHIVDLPDSATARAFAFDEPNYQAGVYRDVLLRRWRNTLGRTMWDFAGGRTGGDRYLVLGLGTGQAADLAPPIDHFLIRENGSQRRTPIHRRFSHVGQPHRHGRLAQPRRDHPRDLGRDVRAQGEEPACLTVDELEHVLLQSAVGAEGEDVEELEARGDHLAIAPAREDAEELALHVALAGSVIREIVPCPPG